MKRKLCQCGCGRRVGGKNRRKRYHAPACRLRDFKRRARAAGHTCACVAGEGEGEGAGTCACGCGRALPRRRQPHEFASQECRLTYEAQRWSPHRRCLRSGCKKALRGRSPRALYCSGRCRLAAYKRATQATQAAQATLSSRLESH